MNYYAQGVDLSQIFEPLTGVTTASSTGYDDNGQDLNLFFAPLTGATKAPVTGFRVNSTDLNEFFEPLAALPTLTITRTSPTGYYSKAGITGYILYRFDSVKPEDPGASPAAFTITVNAAAGITGGMILVGGGGSGGNGSANSSGGGGGGGAALTAQMGLPQTAALLLTVGVGGLRPDGKNDGNNASATGVTYQSYNMTAGGGYGGFSYFSTTPTPGYAGVATESGAASGFTSVVGLSETGGTGGQKSNPSTAGQTGTNSWVYDNYATFTTNIPVAVQTAIGATLQNVGGGGGGGIGLGNTDGAYSGAGIGGPNDNGFSPDGKPQSDTTYGAGGGGGGLSNGNAISGVSGVAYLWHNHP